ncbi:histidine phosphatase family protein, partial [Pseudomonas syringae pv. tagetis]
FKEGAGAETFSGFIASVQSYLSQIAEHPAQRIAVFSHGQFIKAAARLVERKPQDICGQAMADSRDNEIKNHVANVG